MAQELEAIGREITRELDGRDEDGGAAVEAKRKFVQSDWNGSAKVALISIERSEAACRGVAAATEAKTSVGSSPQRGTAMPMSKRENCVHVALLRGVNVGGNNIVSMKALKESFEGLGFEEVRTYINSGNVLFRSSEDNARALEERIDGMLAREHGLKGKTVVRSDVEMASLVKTIDKEWNPDPEWRYNVVFLRHTLDPNVLVEQLELKADIERVICCPGTLLWSARASTIGRTTMIKLSSRAVYQDMTVRNVNTTKKILALMQEMAAGPRAGGETGGRAVTRAAAGRTRRTARRP